MRHPIIANLDRLTYFEIKTIYAKYILKIPTVQSKKGTDGRATAIGAKYINNTSLQISASRLIAEHNKTQMSMVFTHTVHQVYTSVCSGYHISYNVINNMKFNPLHLPSFKYYKTF